MRKTLLFFVLFSTFSTALFANPSESELKQQHAKVLSEYRALMTQEILKSAPEFKGRIENGKFDLNPTQLHRFYEVYRVAQHSPRLQYMDDQMNRIAAQMHRPSNLKIATNP